MSATVSACAARSARRSAMLSPSDRRPSHAGRKRGERVVELVPGHGLRSPPVAQLVRRFAREVERIGDAGQALRGASASGRSTPGRHWRARSGGRPDCRCRRWRHTADRAGADRACRTSCRNGRGNARGCPWWRASPPAARPLRSFPIQPKSRALAAESRYRPILVGEVRWASTGAGSSWKLSGGSMWSAAVTKVSKNRQVRRAISRRAWASAADTDMLARPRRRPAGPARDRRRGDPERGERHRQRPRAMPGHAGRPAPPERR